MIDGIDPAPRVRLVLLPGMDGTRIMCEPLLAALPGGLTVDLVTYPVAGGNEYCELLPIVAQAVASGPPCVVLGWSFSGPLAVLAAARYPEQVRGVILAATFVRPPIPALVSWRRLVTPLTFAMLSVVDRWPQWLGRRSEEPYRKAKAKVWQAVPAATLARRARAILRVDVRDELRAYRGPVHQIVSARDRVVPGRNRVEIEQVGGDVTTSVLPGGHFALYTHATEAAAQVMAFAQRCCNAWAAGADESG